MQDTIITDEHIDYIEKELFPKFDFNNDAKVFDKQRRNVIKCMETKDIVACAGSGKTTTLIAKLMILDRFHMEFPQNQGICVLTHTNVAIDEIKEKLGAGSRLLTYPNFFGTIQSFVNTFLAKKAYIHFTKTKCKEINDDFFAERMEYHYQRDFDTSEKNYFNWYFNENKQVSFFKKMSFKESDFSVCENNYRIPKESRQILKTKFIETRQKVFHEGYLTYDDAYHFSKKYLCNPHYQDKLTSLFSKRFKFVFIDEMQDTETHQKEIIDIIFNEEVILQSIGDNNQAIYTRAQDICWKPQSDTTIELTGSKRFHNLIASMSSNICETIRVLEGNGDSEYLPTIIIFDDTKIDKVLEKFGEIIYDRSIYKESDFSQRKIKAVGGVTKFWKVGVHDISSYMPTFIKPTIVEFEPSKILKELLKPSNYTNKHNIQYYRNNIIGAVEKIIRIVGYQTTIEKQFLKEFRVKFPSQYNIFLLKLTNWCKNIYLRKDIYNEVKSYFENDFKDIFYPTYNMSCLYLRKFLDGQNNILPQTSPVSNNNYEYINNETKFNIEVGTVHSVKGETHTATLYLETVAYGSEDYDIKQILDYFKGIHTAPSLDLQKRILRIAHVAITRPKYLLCVAIHKSSLTDFDKDKFDLKAAGWHIEEI